jgi:hypothetical protein
MALAETVEYVETQIAMNVDDIRKQVSPIIDVQPTHIQTVMQTAFKTPPPINYQPPPTISRKDMMTVLKNKVFRVIDSTPLPVLQQKLLNIIVNDDILSKDDRFLHYIQPLCITNDVDLIRSNIKRDYVNHTYQTLSLERRFELRRIDILNTLNDTGILDYVMNLSNTQVYDNIFSYKYPWYLLINTSNKYNTHFVIKHTNKQNRFDRLTTMIFNYIDSLSLETLQDKLIKFVSRSRAGRYVSQFRITNDINLIRTCIKLSFNREVYDQISSLLIDALTRLDSRISWDDFVGIIRSYDGLLCLTIEDSDILLASTDIPKILSPGTIQLMEKVDAYIQSLSPSEFESEYTEYANVNDFVLSVKIYELSEARVSQLLTMSNDTVVTQLLEL